MAARAVEEAVSFPVGGNRLYGILHLPAGAASPTAIRSLVVMVVGGPQTRAGCHRAFLHVARALCARGAPVFRFDYEGLGDSEGAFVGYEKAAPSLRAALDFCQARFPALEKTVLWSLCDGSAACAVYAPHDRRRVAGMVLCNPYVHSAQGQARTYLRHYYLWRVMQRDFLIKLITFRFNPFKSLASLAGLLRSASGGAAPVPAAAKASAGTAPEGPGATASAATAATAATAAAPTSGAPSHSASAEAVVLAASLAAAAPGGRLPNGASAGRSPETPGTFREEDVRDEVVKGIGAFAAPIHFLLSGNDFTAREFETLVREHPGTAALLSRGGIALRPIEGADHNFSLAAYRHQVIERTLEALAAFGAVLVPTPVNGSEGTGGAMPRPSAAFRPVLEPPAGGPAMRIPQADSKERE